MNKEGSLKYLLIISCLLFTSVGWSEDVSYDDLVKIDGLYYKKFSEKPFTGKITGIKQGTIRKGIMKGKWIEYWETGRLKEKFTIKKGNIHGEYFLYNESGNLITQGNYKKGERHGEWLHFKDNGDLRAKGNYKEDMPDWDTVEGKFILYDGGNTNRPWDAERGEIFSLKNGMMEGEHEIWHLGYREKSIFKSDKRQGKMFIYREDSTSSELNFIDDEQDGVQYYYDENGKLDDVKIFINGEDTRDVKAEIECILNNNDLNSDYEHCMIFKDKYINGEDTRDVKGEIECILNTNDLNSDYEHCKIFKEKN